MPSAGPGATGAAGAADHEPLTEELLARLLASATPQEYLDQTQVGERDFAAYLRSLLQQKGLTRADVLRACDVSPSFGYQVFQGTRRPSRDTAIALAFGLGCSLREAQRLLRHRPCVWPWLQPARGPAPAAARRPLRAVLQGAPRRRHHILP